MPISVASPPRLAGVAAPLRALLRAALALEGRVAGEIGIVLTDDATLRALNRRWRGIDRATDVLSFDYGAGGALVGGGGTPSARRSPSTLDAGQGRISGDVLISLDRLSEQARRFRQSEGRELARLVIHGALHLCGHDHHRAGERARMRAAERSVLRSAREIAARLERALEASGRRSAVERPRERG